MLEVILRAKSFKNVRFRGVNIATEKIIVSFTLHLNRLLKIYKNNLSNIYWVLIFCQGTCSELYNIYIMPMIYLPL